PGVARDRLEFREVKRVRGERAVEARPAGRRVAVVEEGGRAEEPFLAHLPLVGARRQVGVGLPGSRPFDAWVTDIALHRFNLVSYATIGKSRFYRSMMAVTPMPPAVQTEISPRPDPRVASSLASVPTIRAPVAANGWPTATEPPLTLSLARSIEPSGAASPSRSRQNLSDSQALSVQSTCAAKASWIS